MPRSPTRSSGLSQPRRRVVLHDPGRALGAQHALVDRVRGVALDVADAAVLQPHLDAAAAGAHVAGGGLDLVAGRGRRVDRGFGGRLACAHCARGTPRPHRARSPLFTSRPSGHHETASDGPSRWRDAGAMLGAGPGPTSPRSNGTHRTHQRPASHPQCFALSGDGAAPAGGAGVLARHRLPRPRLPARLPDGARRRQRRGRLPLRPQRRHPLRAARPVAEVGRAATRCSPPSSCWCARAAACCPTRWRRCSSASRSCSANTPAAAACRSSACGSSRTAAAGSTSQLPQRRHRRARPPQAGVRLPRAFHRREDPPHRVSPQRLTHYRDNWYLDCLGPRARGAAQLLGRPHRQRARAGRALARRPGRGTRPPAVRRATASSPAPPRAGPRSCSARRPRAGWPTSTGTRSSRAASCPTAATS